MKLKIISICMNFLKSLILFVVVLLFLGSAIADDDPSDILDSKSAFENSSKEEKDELVKISKEQYQDSVQLAADRFDGKVLGISSGKQCERDMIMPTIISAGVTTGLCLAAWFAGGPLAWPIGTFLSAACGGAMIYTITQSIQHITCILTTVRDPVQVYDDYYITNPKDSRSGYISTDSSGIVTRQYVKTIVEDDGDLKTTGTKNYVEATKAMGSSFMTVCYRSFAGNVGKSVIGLLWYSEQDKKDHYAKYLMPEELRYSKAFGGYSMTERFQLQDFLVTGGDPQCTRPLRAGEEQIIGNARVKVIESGSKVCAKLIGNAVTAWLHQPILGCHKNSKQAAAPMCNTSVALSDESGRVNLTGGVATNLFKASALNPAPKSYDNSKCFSCEIAQSCSQNNLLMSQSPVPVSSMIVQCFFDSMDLALGGKNLADPTLNCKEQSILYGFQKKLSRTVQTALGLILMFFAFKVQIDGQLKQKDFITFVIKFALVFYFVDPQGGMREYYMQLRKLNSGLVNMVFEASSNSGLCHFPSDDYKISRQEYNIGSKKVETVKLDYSFLKIWDMIDCRVLAYLITGLYSGDIPGESELATSATDNYKNPGLMAQVDAFARASQIIIALLVFFIFIIVVSILIWLTIMYIFCFTAIAILIFTSPVFIPMILLQVTKPFFEGWLNSVVGFSMFPIAVVAFCSFFFIMVDDFYFGNAHFNSKTYTDFAGVTKRVFSASPNELESNKLFFVLKNVNYSKKFSNFGGYNSIVDQNSIDMHMQDLYKELLIFFVLLLFFIMFLSIANNIAAEISGGGRAMLSFAQKSANPIDFMKKGMGAAPALAEKLKAAASGGGKKDEGKSARGGAGDGDGGGGGNAGGGGGAGPRIEGGD